MNLVGQMTGKLTYLPEEEMYLVSVIPNQTITTPKNITNTGQITLKATAGSFDITALTSINGIWTDAATIKRPLESPAYDYHVFILGTPLINPTIEAGLVIPLFKFSNKKDCQGSIELINNYEDEFWPPNSMDVNIGNQLTVLGFGFNNAYEQNDESASKIECPENLVVNITIDTLKCSADSTTLSLEILDGDLPFIYSINLNNSSQLKDSLTSFNNQQIVKVPVGNHSISRFDQSSSFSQEIAITSPTPLTIAVLAQKNINCHNQTGSILVQGSGGLEEDSFEYNWSNEQDGNELNQLPKGIYEVTLTDINNCRTSKLISIKEAPPLRIDSIELYTPTCKGADDGIIEMVSISNGKSPYQFGLDNNPLQKDNYFDNLKGGVYQVNVTDAENCVTSKRVTLDSPSEIEVNSIPKDTFLIKGEQMLLQPIINFDDPLFYNWTPNQFLSCANCPYTIAQPSQTITYTLMLITPFGCEKSFDYKINVLEKTPFYVPNIFSPTANSDNNTLTVFIGPTIQHVQRFQIFNRWGQLIHTIENGRPNRNIGWDGYYQGQLAESDVYIYVIEVLLKNNKTKIFKGDFFLKK